MPTPKKASKKAAPRKRIVVRSLKKAAPAKKAPAKKAPVKKAAPARKAPVAKKAPVKKAPVKKAAPARKAPVAKKAPVKKAAPARKAPVAKKAPAARTAPAKAAAKRIPGKNPFFDDKFLAAQKELLLEERATYLRQASSLKAEADSLVADVEPGDVQFDEESGEGTTLAVERERDLALSAQATAAVEEIDRALAKLTDGTYGVCEVSGQAIPKERLRAIPWARERVEYKAAGLTRR